MEMKTIRNLVAVLALLLVAPMLRAQDLSKYRAFSVGSNLPAVLKLTEQKPADAKTIHVHPTLIQEVTWWPPALRETNFRSDSVEQILFSFSDGQLYKMSVTYDQSGVAGLTIKDLVDSMSVKYGTPTKVAAETTLPASDRFASAQTVIASWEDPLYQVDLVRSSYSDGFGLVITSKNLNVQAETAIAEAVKREEQERPLREAELRKKEADDLEAARQKNKKIFHP
jgi:hypothetical protein